MSLFKLGTACKEQARLMAQIKLRDEARERGDTKRAAIADSTIQRIKREYDFAHAIACHPPATAGTMTEKIAAALNHKTHKGIMGVACPTF